MASSDAFASDDLLQSSEGDVDERRAREERERQEKEDDKRCIEWLTRGDLHELLDGPTLRFEKKRVQDVLAECDDASEHLVVIAFGVTWCYPTRRSLEHVQRVAAEMSGAFSMKVELHLIDQDQNIDYCYEHRVPIGVPSLTLYYKQQRIAVRRNGKERPAYVGPINTIQAEILFQSACLAVKSNVQHIDVKF